MPESNSSILFDALTPETRNQLMALGSKRDLTKGETLFHRGAKSDSVAVLDVGRVEISTISVEGRRFILNYLGPGAVIGEIGMLDGGVRTADVIAATKSSVTVLQRQDVRSFLQQQPDAMWSLISEICFKARSAIEMFEAQVNADSGTRLARCLIRLAARFGSENPAGEVVMAEAFSQSDLGDFSGLTRETVNRLMKSWEGDGWVRIEGRKFVVTDLEAIEDLAAVG